MSNQNTIAEIRTARLSQSLTQADAARMAGIPLRTYQRLESGDRGSKLDTLLRALDALGLSLKTVSKHRPSLEELDDLYGNE
jgi:transcriptional regulator with XRE-family HTH domain